MMMEIVTLKLCVPCELLMLGAGLISGPEKWMKEPEMRNIRNIANLASGWGA